MMQGSPEKTPEPPWDRNRTYVLLLRILRIFLTVFFLCLGVALLTSSYLVWRNNDLIPAILGSVLFLFGSASFIALGIEGIGKLRRRP